MKIMGVGKSAGWKEHSKKPTAQNSNCTKFLNRFE
jgi:hypothetical protein